MCAHGNRKENTTNDERLAILRMVEEGKITVDEAVQLLDALRAAQRRAEQSQEDRPRDRERGRPDWQPKFETVFNKVFDKVFEVQSKFGGLDRMFEDLFQSREDQTVDIPEGSEVAITCHAGSLTVRGTDSGQMRVGSDHRAFGPLAPRVQVDRETKRVDITATAHSLTVEVPWQAVAVQARVTGGNMTVSDLSASLTVKVAGGSLDVRDVTGALTAAVIGGPAELTGIQSSDLNVEAKGGSVSVTLGTLTAGTVALKTVGGNIALRLSAASAFEIDAEAKPGALRTNLPIAVQTGTIAERIRGVYNGGGATVQLSARAGNIDVTAIEAPATEPVASEEGQQG